MLDMENTLTYSSEYTFSQDQGLEYKSQTVQAPLLEMIETFNALNQGIENSLASSESKTIKEAVEKIKKETTQGQQSIQAVIDELIRFDRQFQTKVTDMNTQPFVITYIDVSD
ncbi:hypothetical protein HUG15_00405 [Salicibibacter cibarius]|uniref:LXG domain-containing protein n=1 Tax=Salicibibacter cibarius TaxID=2743000 RepID=A0A7T6YZK8_9BACI|nr:hypothetical protein [Salicibibacter cibarius]QQK74230.1 hypothetical protein HUG15_00405 [Salicibibacter cibarius]